jgi:uncharacterized membrane protein YdjX (TVP38/TMEM64 family)
MTTYRWLLALAVVIVGALILFFMPFPQEALEPFLNSESWREWREWLRSFGMLAPLASLALSVAQILPLPIPAPLLPLANGWLFGIWGGTFITWLGIVLNGILRYWLARGPARYLFTRFMSTQQLAHAEALLSQHGLSALRRKRSLTLAILIPAIPFSMVCIVAGLLNIRWHDFLLALMVGVMPSAFALALMGHQLSQGTIHWPQITLALIILSVIFYIAVLNET